MRRKLAPVVSLCVLLAVGDRLLGQNGPDSDPDAMPGYTKSSFHHGQVDSINLYNGGLTIPIALGPLYPVGPKLRFQAVLTYNSTVWEFGNPGPDNQSDLGLYEPIKADPSLGVGWGLSAGAIKPCGVVQNSNCYVGPDGAEHIFEASPSPNYYKTSDATQFLLHYINSTAGYEMWDGEGNHYVFSWHVTGYDDLPQDFINDLGRGRNGWYLTALTDPFGNGITASYYTSLGSQPCWTPAHCPTATNSWIVKNVKRGSTTLMTVNLGTDSGAPGIGNLVASLDFAVAGGGTARWTLSHGTAVVTRGEPNLGTLSLVTITSVQLPASVQYSFTWNTGPSDGGYGGLMRTMTLPTAGVISYVWGAWSFYHGRTASININCYPLGPPNDADVKQSGRAAPGQKTNLPDELLPEMPAISGNDCSPTNPNRWLDSARGVIRRTETLGGVDSMTDYAQYAFPFGEQGTVANRFGPQTLTLVTAAVDVDVHRTSAGTLFWGAPGGSPSGGGTPGGRVGAEIRVATYDSDPYPGLISPFPQPLCGGAADALCVTHAIRVTQRTFEYDDPTLETRNRRLKSETTYFDNTNADGTCPGCAYHTTSFSNTGSNTWEGNGRHYNKENHSGNLGGDSRTITTVWVPENWMSPPPAGESALPNLANQRTEAQGSSIVDRYFEHDTATGFSKGSFIYDAVRDIAFLNCRYVDGGGNVDKEFTATYTNQPLPPQNSCSLYYPTLPDPFPNNGDAFAKDYTWQNGELLTARWINGAVSTSTFNFRNFVRDATTGWVTSSKDTAALATSYAYDSLGRVTLIDPPGADLSTFVCYEGPNATTAYRASAAQICPVAPTNGQISTWEHYDYDGLGRTIREKRRLPAAAVSKRFTLYDGPGHAYFTSEWVADSTSEAISKDLSTSCVFVSNPSYGTARPSTAPGTFRMCFDPFGRPQQIVGSKHSSLATADRNDGASPYSETSEKVKTYCVNATFANLQQASCNAGGLNPETTTRKDAFGRITKVTEPSNEYATYAYDANGKLTSVTQGGQTRTFAYDAAGFLRSETTPEAGTVTYGSIGSLGNVLQETKPGSLVLTRKYDFAGRLAQGDAAGSKYFVNCYDGATCIDGSPGYSGGSYPGGKLTRRYGYNWIPTVGPVVDEQFAYSDVGGRLSQLVTSVGNGDLTSTTTQTWSYTNLGLVNQHFHPRTTGSYPVTYTYTNGLPTVVNGNGLNVVTAATYNPAAGLASWTAGNTGTPIVTTIAPDTTLLPRPASISNALWSSGTYTYDGAGNILKMGASDIFTYDNRSRLLSAAYGANSKSFTYDRWGNLLSNGALTFQMDSSLNNHLRIGGSTTSVAYDARGNLTAFNADTMLYDSLDRQYRSLNGSSDWVSVHDGAGERIVKFPGSSQVLRREMARYIAEANQKAGKTGWATLPPACPSAFSDVACSGFYADADVRYINQLAAKGVSAGCGGGNFCPDPPQGLLNRAQMAVFVVKGYQTDGAPTPPCSNIFQDMQCNDPTWGGFAPYAVQLYNDGVTAGCSVSPLKFCPGDPVTEWQILVWLSKTPAVPGGSAWGATYHPVPRGSIYTLRDEQNRVVTEANAPTSGYTAGTLSINRDNVYLGNLLVASNAAGSWQYSASDHLGSPRVSWNSSGVLTESHKYWPYGEDTSGTLNQHLGFTLMERNDGVAQYYDHARTQQYDLGRFMSPDRVGGHPRNPQSWNRYAYTLGNPMKHIDPDGNLTIVMEGTTFFKHNLDFRPGGTFFNHVARTVGDKTVMSFGWSGGDNHPARVSAAKAVANFVRHYSFGPGEKLNFVLHSHSGNVGIAAINMGLGRPVDNLVTLGTPSVPAYRLHEPSAVKNWIHVYNIYDKVQTHGGGDDASPLQTGPAARTHPYALNLSWNVDLGDFQSHEALHSPEVWDKVVLPHLDRDLDMPDTRVIWVQQ